ncbi:HPF/RaiA family ribosome-associated protein [Novispirillum itersonii]|uniref:HPF/RaiA family ribosome-associated protein n=1 Tax=Novispirillum itersonii TaxID=189 RepID=UPI000382659C|nr:HPF/RaiA family ribosome-associated protein [Novispirillum itersonii]
MQIPVQVSFHGVDHSDAVVQRVHEKIAKLEQFCADIISCRVAVEKQHKNNAVNTLKGEPFHVTIDVSVPGDTLIVKRDPKNGEHHDDIGVALRDAFDAMERQVKTYVERHR